ncbi:MAG: hypothetical protein AB7E32_17880 [Desulfovibrio sp.]
MSEGFIGLLVVVGLIWLAMRSKKRRRFSRGYGSTYHTNTYHDGADGDRDGDGIPDSMDSASDSGGSDDD